MWCHNFISKWKLYETNDSSCGKGEKRASKRGGGAPSTMPGLLQVCSLLFTLFISRFVRAHATGDQRSRIVGALARYHAAPHRRPLSTLFSMRFQFETHHGSAYFTLLIVVLCSIVATIN